MEAVLPIVRIERDSPPKQETNGINMILATLACTLLFTAIFLRDGATTTTVNPQGEGPLSRYMSSLLDVFPSRGKLQFFDDFQTGAGQWVGGGKGGDWSYYAGAVRPARLKLWQRSVNMTDYRFEFVGDIQQRGIGWTYRSQDTKNYYASELVFENRGVLGAADLVRYAVLNGKESSRIKMPLPNIGRRDTPYKIRMDVKGSQFTTLINGSVVDTWSDTRLKSGGVGLYASRGSIASIRSASVAEYGNWVSSLFSTAFFDVPLI